MYSVEVFLWENGARNCSMVGATFCLDLGVLEMGLRGMDIGGFPDICRDLKQEAHIHGSLEKALLDTLLKLFILNDLKE